MACRVDVYPCDVCGGSDNQLCNCHKLSRSERDERIGRRRRALVFDYEGALCDVLALVEKRAPATLALVDAKVIKEWRAHQKREKKG
jgi:hypothetical protein